MLIDGKVILDSIGKPMRGVLHIGAHMCEERAMYNHTWKVPDNKIVWIEAIPELVEINKQNGNNCYCAALDEVSKNASFYITNNGQSSSLLELGTHKTYYPDIVVNRILSVETETLATFFQRNQLSPSDYNVWNLDIQGSELSVLKGGQEYLKHVDAIYTEVNQEQVYKGCCTLEELDTFLHGYGFVRVVTKMMPEKWGDALYVRRNDSVVVVG
jgi:FkbM family methyltransferase